MLVLDDDGDVLEPLRDLRRERVERAAHVLLEAQSGRDRLQRSRLLEEIHREHAEDETADVREERDAAARRRACVTEIVPSTAWSTIQKPRNKIAGICGR